jgi:hypothetical protein
MYNKMKSKQYRHHTCNVNTESTIALKVIYLSCPTYRTHHESFILKLGTGEGSHGSNSQRCLVHPRLSDQGDLLMVADRGP